MATTVLVSGATGLIGKALCRRLRSYGYVVRTLSRSQGDFLWNADSIDERALDGVNCVVHLAGEPIARRWSPSVKRCILDSRVCHTDLLVREILKREEAPVFIVASGIHYYGFDCGRSAHESSPSGRGFLAEVCRRWEGAARPLIEAGNRVVFVRTGVVLSAEGGALSKLLPIFKAGLGGRIASGRQWMSWISLPDLVRIYAEAISNERLEGPVNAVAPEPTRNVELTKALGRALRRPTPFPVPGAALRLLYGEMADETILSNIGVYPRVLKDIGFRWETPTLDETFAHCLV